MADQETFVVVYPEQGGDDNPLSCWNWFLPVHQVRESGEAGVLAGITRQVLTSETRWNIDPGRVYVAGLSGGAMATILARPSRPVQRRGSPRRPVVAATDPSTALQAMGNGGPDPALGQGAAFNAMNGRSRVMPTIVFHGTADSVVHIVNGDQVVQQWMETNRLASNDTYRPDFQRPTTADNGTLNFLPYTVSRWNDGQGSLVQEYWRVTGLEHAGQAGRRRAPTGPGTRRDQCHVDVLHPPPRRGSSADRTRQLM